MSFTGIICLVVIVILIGIMPRSRRHRSHHNGAVHNTRHMRPHHNNRAVHSHSKGGHGRSGRSRR